MLATHSSRVGAQPLLLDRLAPHLVLAGLFALYGPTYWDLIWGRYAVESQGHEAIIIGVAAWLLFSMRGALIGLRSSPAPLAGGVVLAVGLLLYLFGRTQQFLRLELVSALFVLGAVLLSFKGWTALRRAWFPLFFLLFVIPLPYTLTVLVTAPLKAAVSIVATEALAALGYPIGRTGVLITIGQYQLLVAEACAGLHTMFTLEALGLLYTHLMSYRSFVRNALLAVLVVPVAFCANVVRVMILVLITYYFGDAAGQGFVHGFAGMVLFAVALMFILAVDRGLGALLPRRLAA